MSDISNMRFDINSDSIISGIINGEIQARMCCRAKNPNNSENYKKELIKYKEAGIVDSTPSVVSFIKRHPNVFRNSKLISYRDGNIFEEMITLAPSTDSDSKIKTRMLIGRELTPDEMVGMDEFLADFHALKNEPDVKGIINETNQYKKQIERLWRQNEKGILWHIESILGYSPERVGTVNTYVMYPNYDTHRSCQASGTSTSLFLGKRGKDTENRVLAHLAHQAVHQPMLPYKTSMTKQEKEKFHAFIKFLTDKEIYSALSGESSLKIVTPQEDHELMAKIYPYWLGYKYRNAQKEGKHPINEIAKEIQRDKKYFESLPEGSKARNSYKQYEFENLDPVKIAEFFRYKKGMSPYEFINIDFNNRDCVSTEQATPRKQSKIYEELIR